MRRAANFPLVLIAVLVPALAGAQASKLPSDAPVSPPPLVSEASPPPPAVPIPAAEPERMALGGRVALEALTGFGIGLGGGLTLGLVGGLGCINADAPRCAEALLLGAGLGWIGGTSLGVFILGRALHGQGGYGWTLLGSVTGTLAATALLLWVYPPVGAIGLVLLPLAGAVAGYELSSTYLPPRPPGLVGTVLDSFAPTGGLRTSF